MTEGEYPLLFLLGGPGALDLAAEEFVPVAGGPAARIALLLAGGEGWERHLPEYTAPWARRGATRYDVIVPGRDGRLDLGAATAHIQAATGIYIGGGPTPAYRRLYASEPLRTLLRERCRAGVPLAGMSAGALLMPEHCAVPAEDTGTGRPALLPGLGLVEEALVGVHFGEWNALPGVLEAMAHARTPLAWGLDEGACAVFRGGRFDHALGHWVHRIEMADFDQCTYRMTRLEPEPGRGPGRARELEP